MNFKLKNLVIVGVIVLPFGLVALGLWKSYELLKKKEKDEEQVSTK